MKAKYFIAYLMFPVLLFWSSILFANDVKVTASVSKTEVAVGEAFEITFTVNGNAERFDPPSFAGFQVISGPNQSSSMTSINGNTTVSMSLSYDLVGTQEGEYTIGAGSIVVNGKVYKSNALKIKVVKGNPAQSSSQSRAAARGRTQTNVQTVTGNAADVAKNLFIKASVNKTNPYQGEQLTVSYKLYTNVNLVDNSLDKLPDFNGFWSQEIKNTNPNVEWAIEKIKGVSYHVATLKQIILFPERSGNLVLDPLAMTFLVRQAAPSMDIFDQFFGGSYKDTKYKISSAPVNIHVRPLPENGKPAGFQGAVGQFSVQASLDKTQLKANEALNYSLKISGTGNLKLLNAPTVNFPADVEKYDPKVEDQISESLTGVSGSRAYKYLLIPRHEGSYTIEPFQFSYFNPVSGKYVSLPSRAFQIKVSKGDPGANVTAYSGNQQDIKMLNKDIMYIKTTDLALSENGKNFYGSLGYVLSMLLGPALFGLAWWSKKRYEEKNKDLVQVKWRKANKIAARHLAFAAKQLAAGDQKAFYEAIYKGLYGYLSDKLNISAAELNIEHIRTSLRAININEELIGRLGNTLELCEMARYAPVPGSTEQEVFDQSKSIINDIETHA
ncbi:BatD family protein [Pedobacter nutrimenti]|uniref:Oxygen tolerance protein BatD n=1 Tax=Pedobacter nutrimenti TaxID=1241337 RepID=A0A318U6V5_9SPHI|nr:BatD family protein [Pedobacter nutrimenti]PYF68991.1 oxygen tolerance protein BatD [Pedobacter nutrimenti]